MNEKEYFLCRRGVQVALLIVLILVIAACGYYG